MATDMRSNRYASNASTTRRCAIQFRMFGQALKTIDALPHDCRSALIARLDSVRHISHNFGYGVGDDMDDLLAESGVDGRSR